MSHENFKKAIEITKENKSNTALVFDLDSTLFCMKHRTQAIIKDCLKKDSSIQKHSPSALKKLENIQVSETDWSIREIFQKHDLHQEEELLKCVEIFWRKTFFKNDYLHHDHPYKGSVEFVNHLHELGGTVFYLTARNRPNMEKGTLESINKHSFPLKSKDHLILKPNTEKRDAEYKKEEIFRLSQQFKSLLFFENEPVILNYIEKNLILKKNMKHIHLFWMDSTHSRQEQPPKRALPLTMEYVF